MLVGVLQYQSCAVFPDPTGMASIERKMQAMLFRRKAPLSYQKMGGVIGADHKDTRYVNIPFSGFQGTGPFVGRGITSYP